MLPDSTRGVPSNLPVQLTYMHTAYLTQRASSLTPEGTSALPHILSTIDDDFLPVDELRILGKQERNGIGDVIKL